VILGLEAGHSVTAIDLPGPGDRSIPRRGDADERNARGAGPATSGRPQHGGRDARGRDGARPVRKLVYVRVPRPTARACSMMRARRLTIRSRPPHHRQPVGRLTDVGVRKAAYNNT
jgi:hypothetical protein